MNSGIQLQPLAVTCTSSDCQKDLHCFKATQKMKKENSVGNCRDCNAELIDWGRVHQQDIRDVQHTFHSLRRELIRHCFWHVEIDQRAINYARRKGTVALKASIIKRIQSSVGDALPKRDGRQTPLADSGNPIYYAQHATASCCRACIEYWHNIPKKRELTPDEVNYLGELCALYLAERLPNLSEFGEYVPKLKKEE